MTGSPQDPVNFTRLAFTPAVRRMQEAHGSRDAYARVEAAGDRYALTEAEREFIAARDGFYMATVGEHGWPYVQYRGGPVGFLCVVDDTTVAFADFRGNRQYISTGNITLSPKTALILMDYPNRRRLKLWAETEIVDPAGDPELASLVVPFGYPAVAERILRMRVRGYDWNCPQHIVPRLTRQEWERSMAGG